MPLITASSLQHNFGSLPQETVFFPQEGDSDGDIVGDDEGDVVGD
jgi:hypothetical protein